MIGGVSRTLYSIIVEVWRCSLYLETLPHVNFFDRFILFSQFSSSTNPE